MQEPITQVDTTCEVSWSGRVAYPHGLDLMETRSRQRRDGRVPDGLFLLEHPHVITYGRHATRKNLVASDSLLEERGVTVHHTTRGGDITYHGPGQLIGYPIVDIKELGLGARDYVEALEEVLIRTVGHFGIRAARIEDRTGVWVGDDKIAAIGVKISGGVTSHGFALNVTPDLSYFDLIVPCGIRDGGVTSMAKLAESPSSLEDVIVPLVDTFGEVYGRRMTWAVAERPNT